MTNGGPRGVDSEAFKTYVGGSPAWAVALLRAGQPDKALEVLALAFERNKALLGENLTVYGQGLQTRSFCYVDDLVEGLVKLLHSTFPFPVNLGNPQELSIHELAEKVIALTGSASRVSYKTLPVNDPQVRCPDITLAQRVLNWSPKIPLEEGLKRTLHYFKQMVQ